MQARRRPNPRQGRRTDARRAGFERKERSMAHNARHQPALVSRYIPASVPKVIAEDREFSARIRQTRRSEKPPPSRRKSPITQVLISRTLTVCGEVAERLDRKSVW